MKTKRANCPNCLKHSPEARACFEATFTYADGSRRNIWECQNCGHRMPRGQRSFKGIDKPSPAQEKALEALKAEIVRLKSLGSPQEHEFKRCEIKVEDGLMFARIEYGRKGDEGTYAEIFCRYNYHVLIGRNGGVRPVYWTGPKKDEPHGVFAVANWGTEYKAPAK